MSQTVFEGDSKYVIFFHQKCIFRFPLTYYGVINEKIAGFRNNAPPPKPQKNEGSPDVLLFRAHFKKYTKVKK